MKSRNLILRLCPLVCLVACPALAVEIGVNYGNTSWVAAGVPIAISAGPTGHSTLGISFFPSRIQGQTFETTEGFTLDKIWIKYQNAGSTSPNFTMELKLFKLDDAADSDLDSVQTNLFSQQQIHHIPGGKPNDTGGNFITFDVENIALDPATAYGFFFYVTDANPSGSGSPFDWISFSTAANPISPGAHHRLERSTTGSAFDMVFALQSAPLQDDEDDPPVNPSIEMPEPGSALLMLTGLAAMGIRRRK